MNWKNKKINHMPRLGKFRVLSLFSAFKKSTNKVNDMFYSFFIRLLLLAGIAGFTSSCLRIADFAHKQTADTTGNSSGFNINPSDGATGVALNPTIIIVFPEDMDAATITALSTNAACSQSVMLSTDSGFTNCLALNINYDAPTKKLSISPVASLTGNTQYFLRLNTDIKNTNGVPIQSIFNSSFTTLDNVPPVVTLVTSTNTDRTYRPYESITIQVKFSEPVTVTGTPTLYLKTDYAKPQISYTGGTGSDTLTFAYSVRGGHYANDLDYVDTSSLGLGGGTIKDAAGNNATLTLPAVASANSLAGSKNLRIYGFILPDTDQKTCSFFTGSVWSFIPCNNLNFGSNPNFPKGQDGHYNNTPSALTQTADNPNGIVIDESTGLVFENKEADITNKNYTNAKNRCDTLATGSGYMPSSWRLPTDQEMMLTQTLNTNPSGPQVTINRLGGIFNGTPTATGKFYWTQTEDVDSGSTVIGYTSLLLKNAAKAKAISANAHTRCVRGPEYPSPDFTDNFVTGSHQTVLSKSYNLEWTRCYVVSSTGEAHDTASGCGTTSSPITNFTSDWKSALKNCEDLQYAGHEDWRLPNIRELYTLVKREVSTAASKRIDTSHFPLSNDTSYWTSSTQPNNATNAFALEFASGNIETNAKNMGATTFARCVRNIE